MNPNQNKFIIEEAMVSFVRFPLIVMLFLVAAFSGVNIASNDDQVLNKREFNPTLDGRWIGNGISYGAYRDGESPDQNLTSKDNILEDLLIIAKHWNLIRLYGSDLQSKNILEVIKDNNLPIRVMLGAWLDGQKSEQENDEQVRLAIEFANRFKQIVVAVNVGNEIFVDWSWHRVNDIDKVIDQIRQVRAAIKQPVTVSDDYNFWNKLNAKKVADELDFICLHGYALWNSQQLKQGLEWTKSIHQDIQSRHPDHKIAFCETGWATSKVSTGNNDEARLMVGKVGENEQAFFFTQYNNWVNQNKLVSFYFSSFDENWKGGFDGENPMAKAEKHWGLYKSDRSPKKSMR
jgi:exo-beta-1,3-glucanase (GH17 family)